jgi:hypothetical protein
MKKFFIFMALLLFIPIIGIAEESYPWEAWIKSRTEEVAQYRKIQKQKDRLEMRSALSAAMADLELKWQALGPAKELLPLIEKAEALARRCMLDAFFSDFDEDSDIQGNKFANLNHSLDKLQKLIEETPEEELRQYRLNKKEEKK